MTHPCHDPDCDPALDAAGAVLYGFASSGDDLRDRLRRAVAELIQERMERSR